MLNILVNCGPAEDYIADCLTSILSQSVQEWQAFVTIDPSGDLTLERAVAAKGGDPRVLIHPNSQWQGPMVNTMKAIRRSEAQAEDVMVILDGDDKFATPQALSTIKDTYRNFGCWLTYGSWVSDLPDGQGLWPPYPKDLEDFRHFRWLGTGVRTWKRWLWDLVDDSDFRDASGRYFTVGEDQAILTPMLEMCGARARHIPEVLMIYTRSSPYRVCHTRDPESRRNDAYIRSLPRYKRLVKQPTSSQEVRQFVSDRKRVRQELSSNNASETTAPPKP
jgi:glycosyltransferase involved in cell wall biosynthesis